MADAPTFSENDFLRRCLRRFNAAFVRLLHRMKVDGTCELPGSGPAILICNHTSSADPLFVQAACPRIIRFMMAREYYDVFGLRWIFKSVGAIPVERSGRDLAATRQAMRALSDGWVLGVFPEGKIEEADGQVLPFQTGVAMMAIKLGVDIVPAYLEGTMRGKGMVKAVLSPNRVRLHFGNRISLVGYSTSKEDLERATEVLRSAILDLRQKDLFPS